MRATTNHKHNMNLSNRIFSPVDLLAGFDHLFDRSLRQPLRPADKVGVYEADHAWILRTDLPGFSREDLSLRFEKGVLSLRAERENEEHAFHSRTERTFRTPEHVDPDEISARLEDGVLEVTLPKLNPGNNGPLEIKID